ncbi:hypothetical protein [Spiroplasma tabanidicola]|uniref:Uncharacterized protein n=1 Tax=Spiroplasma tabanidicola TaxID=324079 RepID=A0A6I6C638_9MOLU|nr:hypothetical protein [Spiroplasma tabanidicola]QGS52387.1 hypothetical protein STABA_v1c10390 [Spiroplasma tabanidicola]
MDKDKSLSWLTRKYWWKDVDKKIIDGWVFNMFLIRTMVSFLFLFLLIVGSYFIKDDVKSDSEWLGGLIFGYIAATVFMISGNILFILKTSLFKMKFDENIKIKNLYNTYLILSWFFIIGSITTLIYYKKITKILINNDFVFKKYNKFLDNGYI